MQHPVNRDSNVTTGTYAAGINPDHVRQVGWWEHPRFDEQRFLEAAELVAFRPHSTAQNDPGLRERGKVALRILTAELYAALTGTLTGRFDIQRTISMVLQSPPGRNRRQRPRGRGLTSLESIQRGRQSTNRRMDCCASPWALATGRAECRLGDVG